MANYLDPVLNFALGTLSTGYDASATSIVLQTGHGARFPDPAVVGAYNVPWWNWSGYANPSDDSNKEIVRVTALSGDTLTIVRAQEGTSASTKNSAGATYKVALAPTKKFRDDIENSLTYPETIPNFNTTAIPTYTDDIDNIISVAAGQLIRTKRTLLTALGQRYVGGVAQTILATALLASANNTSAITVGGFHYAYIGSSTPAQGMYKIAVTGDLATAGNWTTLTLSGAKFTPTAVLIGYDGTNFWFTDASTTFFKATLSGTTMTQGSSVTVTGSDYSSVSRVNSVGIYAHFAAAPTLRQASLAGALVADKTYAGPTITMTTPLYLYVCSATTNPLTKITY